MKLLMIYGDPRIPGLGGVEEHSRNLIKYLSKNPHLKINVLTYGNEDKTLMKKGVKYRILKRFISKVFLYFFFIPLDFFRILRIVNKQKPDLIHFQGTHPLYCISAVFLKRRYPILITVHGIMTLEVDFHSKNFFSRYFSKVIEEFSLKRLDNVIVVAPQIKDIVDEMTESKTLMIPNGVDLKMIDKIHPLKNPGKPYILFIGIMIKLKGVIVLLEALIKVKSQIPDCCLLLVGSGLDEGLLKEYAKNNGLKENVKFLGYIKGDLKYSYLKSSQVVVLPSLWESLPISILEGMGCGKPIVASDVGGIPLLVEDGVNGFLVKPGNADDLADKIITLLKDKDLRDFMGRNSELKAKNFDWAIITQKTIETYGKIIGRGI